jgi:ABC-type multidrug transport system ATPase subunit
LYELKKDYPKEKSIAEQFNNLTICKKRLTPEELAEQIKKNRKIVVRNLSLSFKTGEVFGLLGKMKNN